MISLPTLALIAVLANPGDVVLLDFHADWCGPCRSMDPTIRKLVADGYPVRKVNIDRDQQLARQYGVDRVPTYVLVAGGREITRVVGPTNYAGLVRMFAAAQLPAERSSGGMPCSLSGAQSAGQASGSISEEAKSRAMQATVRLRVEDQGGNSVGTGTVVDVHNNEALVMTCAHIFRDSRGHGQIQVDLFAPGAKGPVPGKVIDYDLEQDVALVAIRPGIALTSAPVAGRGFAVRRGDAVFSIGCDRGADPSIRESHVTDLNKYVGPANIEVGGAPVIGRSGGGLFSADGRLIGICNLADPKDDEGIYADTSLLHTQLDENNLAWIYNRQSPAAPQEVTPSRELAAANAAAAGSPHAPPRMAPQMPRTPLGERDPSPPATPAAPASSDAQPLISVAGELSGDMEVICIVRSRRDPNGKSRVFVLEQPSRELLNQLASESDAVRGDDGPRVLEASLVGAGQTPPRQDTSGRGPVMRGQAE